ncbi:MAG: hypothetical protein AAFP98_09325 [Pseudomonadota bacterium]
MKTVTALTLSATAATADVAGYTPLVFEAPHHGREVLGAIWYPAQDDGRAFTFAENGVFFGVEVVEEASLQDGTFPIVLLSHGMGGNIRSFAWLGSALAKRWAIVVSVNHPNSTWGDFDLKAGMNHGTRTKDLSVALDVLNADPLFQEHLDTERVMAAGFSYGGWTALSLGGVTGNHAGYVAHCTEHGDASSHCSDLMSAEIQLGDADPDVWNASYADARVTHVVAVDPGLTWGLNAADVAGLVPNVSLVGLGEYEHRLLATDFDASGFANLLPNATHMAIAPAFHFSALPLCKPMGAAILAEEGDDPVCTDPAGTDRAKVHQAIVRTIAAELGL